jgi:hypothetical protein
LGEKTRVAVFKTKMIMSKTTYKNRGRVGLFDKEETKDKLTNMGNPLERLSNVIDFEMFRGELELSMLNHDKKNSAGAKPYDVVMMFKIVVLKRLYNLSNEQAEYQINNRLSFRNFLGLSSGDRVPDARTIWLFQDRLIKGNLEERLFARTSGFIFKNQLQKLILEVPYN